MPVSTPYKVGLFERLKDPEYAAAYLNAAEQEGVFLEALRNVAEVYKISKVAETTGLNRETLYRTLSAEGNPTRDTQKSILAAVGLKHEVVPLSWISDKEPPSKNVRRYLGRSQRVHGRPRRRRDNSQMNQMKFSFPERSESSVQVTENLANAPQVGIVGIGITNKWQSTLDTLQAGTLFLESQQVTPVPAIPPELLAAPPNSVAGILSTF